MEVKVEKLENNEVKLDITVEAEKFDKAMDDVFKKNSKYFQVPGFRKGHAPKSVVLKYYNESILYEDAFNELVPGVLEEAYKENDLDVVASPDLDVSQIGGGKDLIFSAVVTVKPEVKLGKYKGIKLNKKEYKVTDEDIEERLKKMQDQNSRITVAKEGSKLKDGDTAVIDFEGFVDGVAFEGGKAEGHSLVIGSGSFIPGFEEQLIGMKSEEEKDINVKFPEDYFSKDLAGKDATFKVKLHEIKVKELPKLDDEFAKDVSEFDTLEDLKEDIKDQIEEENALKEKQEKEDEATKIIADDSEVEIPEKMVEAEVDAYVKEMEQNLSRQGLTMDTYLQYIGKDLKSFKEEYSVDAKSNIKTRLVLEAIFNKEELEVKDDDVENKLKEFAKAYNRNVDEYLKSVTDSTKEYVKDQLKYEVAIKYVVANAK